MSRENLEEWLARLYFALDEARESCEPVQKIVEQARFDLVAAVLPETEDDVRWLSISLRLVEGQYSVSI